MYGYIKGKITEIENNYVIIENNGIGYIVYVAIHIHIKKVNIQSIYIII